MSPGQLLGKYKEDQIRAAEILVDEGPVTYDELKEKLEIEDQSVMQSIMRGLSDNGLVRSFINGDGRRKYDVLNEEKVRHLSEIE